MLVGLLAGAAGFDVGVDVELGEGVVAAGRGLDLASLDLELRLGQIRASCEALLDEVGEVEGLQLGGDDDLAGWYDFVKLRDEGGGGGADELVAEDDFLLLVEALGLGEIEAAGAFEGLGAGEFDGSEGAFGDLVLVVLALLGGGAEGFFFDRYVFAQGDEVVVEAGDAVDGFEGLLLEEEAGDLLVGAGEADEAQIDVVAAAAEERLGEGDGGAGGGEGVELAGGAVDNLGVVVGDGCELGAGAEALKVGEVEGDEVEGLRRGDGRVPGSGRAGCAGAGCARSRAGAAAEGDRVRAAEVASGADKLRVEERDVGTEGVGEAGAQGVEVGLRLRRGVEGGEVGDGGGGGVAVDDVGVEQRGAWTADTGGGFGDAVVDAAEVAAATGAGEVGAGERDVVALGFDVEVVFEREGEGVLEGEVEFAVADEGGEARLVAGEELRDGGTAVGA